jgi:ubiquinone biosynthesis protein
MSARVVRISVEVWSFLAWALLVRLRLLRARETVAQRATRTLARLGTAFIKLGQGLSVHRDLLPEDFVIALQALHDRVGPFPSPLAIAEVERALGKPLAELFAAFEPEPFAAGSIAQVHGAVLADGRRVIVKVRRPGVHEQIESDLRVLRFALRIALALARRLRAYDPIGVVGEIWANLRRELDFRVEARNIRKFEALFRESTTVYVPPVVEGMYAESVIVQLRSGGRKIDDPALAARGPALAEALVDASLKQFFDAGVFHGDPHPGNLYIMDDGRICLHDFGLVGHLDRETRGNLAAFMQAFVGQDADWLLAAYLDLGVFAGTIDRAAFLADLTEVVHDYAALPLSDWSFAEAFLRIARIGRGQNIRVPRNLLVYARAMFLLEHTIRTLHPGFNLTEGLLAKAKATALRTVGGVGDIAAERLRLEGARFAEDLPRLASNLLRTARHQGFAVHVEHAGLEELRETTERGAHRIALALVALGLYVAASLLMQHGVGPRIGDFPLFAALGYALAVWLTLKLIAGSGD